MNYTNKASLIIHLWLFFVLFLSSCISSKKIKYLQGDENGVPTKFTTEQREYHVQKGDNLYIKLSSTEPFTNQAIAPEISVNTVQSMEAKYRDVYLIDSQGKIKLPQLGEFMVDSLSLKQIKDSIEWNIQKYFKQVTVNVRLADNYITIIGDVEKPGRYLFDFRDKISIFELIGMAGDLTYEANRKNIKLLRKIGNETFLISLDLTSQDVLSGQYYYLFPNDVLIVEPLKAVTLGQKSIPFATTLALILSVTTSVLVIISYLK